MPQINEAYAYCETCNIYFYYTKDGCPLCKKTLDMDMSKKKNMCATAIIAELKKEIKDLSKPEPKPIKKLTKISKKRKAKK
ncbi:MAG: hypothetical protein ACYSUK_12800 [Planctomycetota bacterium]|jgi:hypothetical protein